MKPWETLLRRVEIRIKPQPGRDLTAWVDTVYEYDGFGPTQRNTIQVNSDRVEIRSDYPDEFKKLVAACDSPQQAYEIYNKLQAPVPVNWEDFL